MKKQAKKKLEHDLAAAIETVLGKHDSHGIPKTKKAIKQSVKSVVKKFNKAIKALAEQKKAVKAKRKTTKKITPKKSNAIKPAAVRYHKTKNTILSAGTPPVISQPAEATEGGSQENQ